MFPVKKGDGGGSADVLRRVNQSTQKHITEGTVFQSYKQQIKTQAVTAQHFTAVAIREEHFISAFFSPV